MLRSPDEVQTGRIVYLFPHTKQASANVHRMLTVTILQDPAKFWPHLVVGWKEHGTDFWEKVHKDNVRLRSPAARNRAEEKEGDTTNDHKRGTTRVRVMPGKAKAEPTEGQGTLF